MSDLSKILDRVAKLLNLAGNNPNEAEAASAIEKAHEILAAHNLSMQSVEQHQSTHAAKDEKREANATETNFSEKQFAWIWGAVAELNYCKCFHQRPNPHKRQTIYTLVGRQVNVIVASQMAMYLCQTMRRLMNDAAKAAGRTDHAYKNAFLAGCAARLHNRLIELRDAEKKQAATGGTGLVLWRGDEAAKNDEFIAKQMGIVLRSSKRREGKYDWQGAADGRRAAEGVNLGQQVGARAAAKQIG